MVKVEGGIAARPSVEAEEGAAPRKPVNARRCDEDEPTREERIAAFNQPPQSYRH